MRTNQHGKMIKFLVTDAGIQVIDEDHPDFTHADDSMPNLLPIFETFEEAAMFAIESMSERIKELEDKASG